MLGLRKIFILLAYLVIMAGLIVSLSAFFSIVNNNSYEAYDAFMIIYPMLFLGFVIKGILELIALFYSAQPVRRVKFSAFIYLFSSILYFAIYELIMLLVQWQDLSASKLVAMIGIVLTVFMMIFESLISFKQFYPKK